MSTAAVIVFYDDSFPFEGVRPSAQTWSHANQVQVVDAHGLSKALSALNGNGTCINLHGPYFPKEAWSAIIGHLRLGGGLVHTGGAPFQIPVVHRDGVWLAEQPQTAYHQEIGIHEALKVKAPSDVTLRSSAEIAVLAGSEALFEVKDTYGFALHVTHASDMPHENGSGGPMDARIYPLLTAVTESGRELAAPVVLLEYVKGIYAGARWIFINQTLSQAFWQGDGADVLLKLAAFTTAGVTEFWLKPNYACYEVGETPVLTLQYQGLNQANTNTEWHVDLSVYLETATDEARQTLFTESFDIKSAAVTGYTRKTLPFQAQAGYYTVEASLESSDGEQRLLKQGFWGRDEALLTEGAMLTAGRDYFYKDGKPMPVVGMTYMTSDVARKFFHLPNVSVWDRDMAQMAGAGINLIRTGIWTALRTMGFVDGHVSEDILRAIDAFVLSSKRHGLELTFNFFAFTPELWEGVNPYLDPRSVEAQKRFISAIVSRHQHTANLHWDLINEPTMFDPKRLWSPRPLRDAFEVRAFREWLKERHESITALQAKWNMTPEQLPSFDAIIPPMPEEIPFGTTEILVKRGGPWLDFVLFSMDMHNRWASELREAIHAIQPKQMVTVGQDEGLGAHRPSPLFYEEAVDYTTVHSWWLMDQLVWDGIFSKAPNKPSLIQETGIMYVETPDGRAKRSEEELRNILERKYAYAFSTGGAGAVQWIWNINYYMDNINESHIGALRADGTEKPEADVSYDFGSFMGEIGYLFEDRQLEETVVVFPYSNDFSNRAFAGDATAKLTRALAHRMNVPLRALSEYHLEALAEQDHPKLIILPSAHNLSGEALNTLISHVSSHGGVLLITGPISMDEYWHSSDRVENWVGATRLANVRREEALQAAGKLLPVSFGGDGIAKLTTEWPVDAVTGEAKYGAAVLQERVIGKGKLMWCPLPLELNESYETLETVYRHALKEANVAQELEWISGGDLPGVYGRKLAFREGSLYIFVSEYGMDCRVNVKDPVTGRSYGFELEAERTVMFAADAAGELVAVYRPQQVEILTDTKELA
ncbi:beta-galactosidase [Paenibacillus swuensis]|uniref:beta-galactosidase n=1 Tax=Paenibacillus swuensis TaxID=1178515 RepID=UPI000B28CC43|nr:beta-galactosidase [Paenibacillus swuensis]